MTIISTSTLKVSFIATSNLRHVFLTSPLAYRTDLWMLQNILIFHKDNQGVLTIKICDFGISIPINKDRNAIVVGAALSISLFLK